MTLAAAILAELTIGTPAASIAAQLGCTPAYVRNVKSRHGLAAPMDGRKAHVDEAFAALTEIADRHGVAASTVAASVHSRFLRRRG